MFDVAIIVIQTALTKVLRNRRENTDKDKQRLSVETMRESYLITLNTFRA